MARIDWQVAPDVQARILAIVEGLGLAHVDPQHIVCVRSTGSSARFLARIWPLPRVWQLALGVEPHYVIEVKHERFDRLAKDEQDEVLIHELMHIPRTFSGAVLPHRHNGGRIDERSVEILSRRWRSHLREQAAMAHSAPKDAPPAGNRD